MCQQEQQKRLYLDLIHRNQKSLSTSLCLHFHSSTLRTLAAAGYVWAATSVHSFSFFFNLHVLEWGHTCAVQDKIYIISWYFWDEKSDFSIHFGPELTVFSVGGPEYFRPATEKRPENVKICELRQQDWIQCPRKHRSRWKNRLSMTNINKIM